MKILRKNYITVNKSKDVEINANADGVLRMMLACVLWFSDRGIDMSNVIQAINNIEVVGVPLTEAIHGDEE